MSNPPDKPYQGVELIGDVDKDVATLNALADQGLYFQGMLYELTAVVGNYRSRGGN